MKSAFDHSSRPNSVQHTTYFRPKYYPLIYSDLEMTVLLEILRQTSVFFLSPTLDLHVQSIVSSFYYPNNNLYSDNCIFLVFSPAIHTYAYILLSSLHILLSLPYLFPYASHPYKATT
jgi:hypothetical protein